MVRTDRSGLICHLLDGEGQCSSSVRIVAFNTAEGWSLDVTDNIAATLAQACADRDGIPPSIADFIAEDSFWSVGAALVQDAGWGWGPAC